LWAYRKKVYSFSADKKPSRVFEKRRRDIPGRRFTWYASIVRGTAHVRLVDVDPERRLLPEKPMPAVDGGIFPGTGHVGRCG